MSRADKNSGAGVSHPKDVMFCLTTYKLGGLGQVILPLWASNNHRTLLIEL